ncbi:MAG: hypothetical protein NZO58_04850, partial [Gemmataceae bacterium]|nr:hypothetical protein [Gemmataceae bacterium]
SFIPESIQPSSAAVLLTKPTPRWLILFGKYLGVVALVVFQAGVFFLGTWAALGLTTGVWLPEYLLGWPLLVVQFATFVGFSVYLGTVTRSAIAAALGSVLFWVLCMAINYGRFSAISLPILTAPPLPTATAQIAGVAAGHAIAPAVTYTSLSPLTLWLIDASYWLFPKPADMVIILEQALNAKEHTLTLGSLPEFRHAIALGHWQPLASLLTSLVFGLVMVGCAGRTLNKMDY